jgi:hypothetical protein
VVGQGTTGHGRPKPRDVAEAALTRQQVHKPGVAARYLDGPAGSGLGAHLEHQRREVVSCRSDAAALQTRDDASQDPVFFVGGNVTRVQVLVPRSRYFLGRRKIEPQLKAVHARGAVGQLAVDDARARRHRSHWPGMRRMALESTCPSAGRWRTSSTERTPRSMLAPSVAADALRVRRLSARGRPLSRSVQTSAS